MRILLIKLYLMKHLKFLLLLLLAGLAAQTMNAHDFVVNGIYYNKNGSEATVTYRGTSYNQYSSEYTGTVNIPSSVTYNGTTYSVTAIGNNAFSYCTGLTSIDIPNSVTTIGFDLGDHPQLGDGDWRLGLQGLLWLDLYRYPQLGDDDWQQCLRVLPRFDLGDHSQLGDDDWRLCLL